MTKFKTSNTEDYYFVKSIRVFHFLKANGFWYLYKDNIPNSDKYCFVFEKTPELMEAMEFFMEEKRKYFETLNK